MRHDKDACTKIIGLLMAFTVPRGVYSFFIAIWNKPCSQCDVQYFIQTDSGTHPTSYPTATGRDFPGLKRSGLETGHSCPTSAEGKNT
jgi:hypothetical protein